ARTTELVIVAGRGGVQRSTDGAATFRRVGARALRGARLTQLDEAGRAVFAFGDRALARSLNNGRTWRRIRRPTRREVVDADFVSARVGWLIAEAGGAGQRLYKTRNAGRTWRLIRSIGTGEVYSLGFATSRSGMVDVDDDDGRVLRTSDGGRTWRPQFISSDTLTVGGLTATGPGTALATDVDGNIFATTTGGDALDSSRLTLRSNRRRLRRSARITLTGRLTPRLEDEQIVIASLARGRWRQRTVETSADGAFRLRVRVRRSTRFVAQWDGDGDARGAGTRSLLVRVRR
nr:hypothetical protein [Actinomycetota bacterium]